MIMSSRGQKIRDLALKCNNEEVESNLSNIIDNDLLTEALKHDALLEPEFVEEVMLELPSLSTSEDYKLRLRMNDPNVSFPIYQKTIETTKTDVASSGSYNIHAETNQKVVETTKTDAVSLNSFQYDNQSKMD